MRTKICGIRSEADLHAAVAAGADAIGFISGVTHISEDALDRRRAAALSAATPPFVTRVLVTHLEDPALIIDLADQIGADAIQVHRLVSVAVVARVHERAGGRPILAAVPVTGPEAVHSARAVAPYCDAVLLDSPTADRLGGTGHAHDWSISATIVRAMAECGRPVVLAGGLTPGTVAAAIRRVRPYAVDVNSGVETFDGDKDPAACAAFVAAARPMP
ncbi:phosphoribosylanthranilate isomerase [Nocardia abscessus]|uniref:phosphoribosylanthranilate isomerase n=1 Tax=Nocardia abscessus TaxID=120957 RepID=UPI0002E74380|nr:phosphoribosylanthranilate isomerase [Nocardia abscessus]MCC3333396.1 phosphoribosylanthranilate isomerase [Nocardia abscessus]